MNPLAAFAFLLWCVAVAIVRTCVLGETAEEQLSLNAKTPGRESGR